MSYTPGPWHRNIKPARKYNTVFAGRNKHIAHLATVCRTDEELEGNCNLIAAAPELLEALRALVEWGREHTSPRDENSPHMLLVAACAAIAKAEGEQ